MQQKVFRREQIQTAFRNVFRYPLTLTVAGMGYGKTTSARDFLQSCGAQHIWLSIDCDESSQQYIWDSFARQLAKVRPEIGSQLGALGFPADKQQKDKVLRIIEDITFRTNTVLVIDDFHYGHAAKLNNLIESIVRMKIEGFHILLLSRSMPEMDIDELIHKGYCYLIKNHLFEINATEIKEFFTLYGYPISNALAKQVYDMSEGWVSAVYLMMQRYAEINRIETCSSIEELIETAVMARYSERESLLLKTLCIFDSFTPEQAAYVSGEPEAERMIKNICSGNAFIRYHQQEDVYRIHKILNHYLEKQVSEQLSDMAFKRLYKRSGEWYIHNGDIMAGLRHYLKAEEYDLIMMEFEKSTINLIVDNHSRYILQLFDDIPHKVKYRYPIGFLSYIGFYVTNIDPIQGTCLLEEFERYYLSLENLSAEMKRRILGEVELIKAYTAFNDAAAMCERMKAAHKMLDGRSYVANKDKIITFGSPHSLYLYYRESGKFLWSMTCVEEMFPYYMEVTGGCGKGFDDLLKAEYHLETGHYEKAELFAYKAMYKAKTMEQTSVIICAGFTVARLCLALGKTEEALELMNDLSDEAEACNSPILNSAYDVCIGYIGSITENENSFSEWLKAGDFSQSEVLYQGMGFNYVVYGKYLLLKNNYIRLEVFCEQMLKAFSPFNNMLGYLHAYMLKAVARYKNYGFKEAKGALMAALDIGKADNILLPFAEYGKTAFELLMILKKEQNMSHDGYLDRLLDHTAGYCGNLKPVHKTIWIMPALTNREIEILRLVVEGKTNREIGKLLFIAEVTVRKNITAIYRKLNVNGRASAVRKAVEYRIL